MPATLRAADPAEGDTSVGVLSDALGISRVLATLLRRRGVATPEAARLFLDPDPARLADPFELKGASEAANVLVAAARKGKRIVVFGDYDVDGVTAVAQLRASLRRAGADAIAFLPHRLRDGYGLKPETVRRVVAEQNPAVLITVDCGITALEGVACAREAGVDVIVTDHHIVGESLPAGAIVVNPRQEGCTYPEKDLAACGIALQISLAVASRAGFALSRESLLRVAALGTIADLVPLTGENRLIAAAGLTALGRPRAPGLTALLREAGVAAGRSPTSEQVAFRVAPRLNAAGRLDTAELALALLEEPDRSKAAALASELSRRNSERQTIERRVAAEARQRVEREYDLSRDCVIVEGSADWHRGVLGIAASRIAREYHRPVLLFGFDGVRAIGSGRSIPGVHLHDIGRELQGFLEEFGGHAQAVGGALPADRFEEFRSAARALFAERVSKAALERPDEVEIDLPLEEVTADLTSELRRLEPHGAGNPRPLFRGETRIDSRLSPLGEHGVRGLLGRSIGSIAFHSWDRDVVEPLARAGTDVEVDYRIVEDRTGRPAIEVTMARPAGTSERRPRLDVETLDPVLA